MGCKTVCGHFGLDLKGPISGVIRIDELVIEDVTELLFSGFSESGRRQGLWCAGRWISR